MRLWPVATVLLFGCAPPNVDPVDTGVVGNADPSVTFVHPPPGETFEVELDEDCHMRVLVALDIDNFELFEPESRPPTDAEGHFHVSWNGGAYLAISEAAFELDIDAVAENLTVGVNRNLRVTLQANDHADLDQFDDWEATVEYVTVDPSGLCGL